MLKGRLGLETARVPHTDRHGVMWLGRGNLYVEAGTLRFRTAGYSELEAGDYAIPLQMVSCFLLEPGTTISHDSLRLTARQGTAVLVCGRHGVRYYASLPKSPNTSSRARRHARLWNDPQRRTEITLKLYELRFGERLPATDINALRGIEGSRMRASYQAIAQQYGLKWRGRRYDRQDPESADVANQAINHAASAVEGAALCAVAATGAIPQLGFIHEDSGIAFGLDIADLFRTSVTLPVAFRSARTILDQKIGPIESIVRTNAGRTLRKERVVAKMIDNIKELLDGDDNRGDP